MSLPLDLSRLGTFHQADSTCLILLARRLFFLTAFVSQSVSMPLCSTMFVEVAIVHCRIVTLVATVSSLRFTDTSMFQTRQVCCPVKLAVSVERAPLARIHLSLVLHTVKVSALPLSNSLYSAITLKQLSTIHGSYDPTENF